MLNEGKCSSRIHKLIDSAQPILHSPLRGQQRMHAIDRMTLSKDPLQRSIEFPFDKCIQTAPPHTPCHPENTS